MLRNWEWGGFFTQEFPAFLGFPEFLEFPVLGTGNAVFFPRIPKIPKSLGIPGAGNGVIFPGYNPRIPSTGNWDWSIFFPLESWEFLEFLEFLALKTGN